MLLCQGDNDAVVDCRGLKLEVKRSAKALAQSQPPGSVDPCTERRLQDELHATGLVEEPLGHDGVMTGKSSQGVAAHRHVLDGLFGAATFEAAIIDQEGNRLFRTLLGPRGYLFPDAGDFHGKLYGSAGGFSQPERNIGSRSLSILHPHPSRLDSADAPGCCT